MRPPPLAPGNLGPSESLMLANITTEAFWEGNRSCAYRYNMHTDLSAQNCFSARAFSGAIPAFQISSKNQSPSRVQKPCFGEGSFSNRGFWTPAGQPLTFCSCLSPDWPRQGRTVHLWTILPIIGCTVSPRRMLGILTPKTCDCDLTWNWVSEDDRVRMRS